MQIRALRRARGLSQAQLATLVGTARKAMVYQWEARKRTPSPLFGVVAQIKCEVERDPDETGGMQSRVHPKYKTKYRVRNWASYERALIGRGNITIWLSRAASARPADDAAD